MRFQIHILETISAIAFAAATFISSVMPRARTASAPLKMVMCDKDGALYDGAPGMTVPQAEMAKVTNHAGQKPPKLLEMSLTVFTIVSTSLLSMQTGNASTSANALKSAHFLHNRFIPFGQVLACYAEKPHSRLLPCRVVNRCHRC